MKIDAAQHTIRHGSGLLGRETAGTAHRVRIYCSGGLFGNDLSHALTDSPQAADHEPEQCEACDEDSKNNEEDRTLQHAEKYMPGQSDAVGSAGAEPAKAPAILLIAASRGLGLAMADEFLKRGW